MLYNSAVLTVFHVHYVVGMPIAQACLGIHVILCIKLILLHIVSSESFFCNSATTE